MTLARIAAQTLLALVVGHSVAHATDKPLRVYILVGQSNMQGLDHRQTFEPHVVEEYGKDNVLIVKEAIGGRPIRMWVHDWEAEPGWKVDPDIPNTKPPLKEENGILYDSMMQKIQQATKGTKPKAIAFCWMQGERDANGGADAAYKAALKQLIANLRRDLERPDMNIVIARIGDYALDRPSCVAVRQAQRDIADEDAHGAWVDVDDLNDREVDGEVKSVVHYEKEGYVILGQRFARQGYALIKGKKPAEDGRP